MLSPPVDRKGAYELPAAASTAATSPPSSSQSSHASPPEGTQAPKYTEQAFESVLLPPGGEEPPPHFTPYEAEFLISGKEIVSHDPHLNEDGEWSFRIAVAIVTTAWNARSRG